MANDAPSTMSVTADKRAQLLRKLMREQGLAPEGADHRTFQPIPRRPAGQDRVAQSFAQRRLWFLDRLAPGNPFYTVSVAVPIDSYLDVAALRRALDALVRRHEVLRTTFTEADGQALQVVAPPGPAALELIDLSALSTAVRENEAERLSVAENSRSFDLERGPLMVARLLTLGPNTHRLLLTLHHIICDGWSLRVLSHELLTSYSAYATGTAPELPELPIQYADFSLWQHAHMAGAASATQLTYWRRVLDGAPELNLVQDHARPPVPSFRGGFVPLAIGAEQAAAVTRLCGETGATPFVVLMAAYMALLARLSGQGEFMVGTPIAGRTRPQLEPLIGFFVNTLVLRADLVDAPTFRTLVERVRVNALDAFANQDLPFERLVEEMAPQRVLGRNPLFQVIFQLFSAQDGARGVDTPQARQRGTAKFDLRLDLWPSASGYAGELEYSEDIFTPASAARMARQFSTLLANLLAAPDAPVDAASALDAAELRQVLETFNSTAAPYPDDCGVATLFAEMVGRHGATPALEFADASLSYSELDAAASALARRLVARGAGRGQVVGVLVERSAAMIVAWLAVLKLGGAYLPLDADQPAPRLAGMLEDAGVRLVLATGKLLPMMLGIEVAIETVDTIDRTGSAADAAWPAVGGGDLAQVIFTSGSSGRPKGVRIAHRGIARLTRGVDWVAFRPGERVAQAANPAFDASTYEVWSALLNGCTLVGVERDALMAASLLEQHLQLARIDHLFLTTALFIRHAAERPGMFACLLSLMTGGARGEPASFRAVLAAGAPHWLLHAYGPTETTVLATVARIGALPENALSVPIGGPLTNTTCYVLDAAMRPLPIGAPGQLYIGGPGVALGYTGAAALNDQRFVPDQFRPGGMLYASGDKVRWRDDGQLEFLGRFDDQVKLRGFRVEPDEVAAVLATHPAVRGAVVIVRERGGEADLDDDKSLLAYVELHDNPDAAVDGPAAAELVAHWRDLYDTVLYDSPAVDATFNTSGWNDSATGAPLAPLDMEEQVGQTVARALATGARRVLEIGCGTGLLLFRIAPHCTRYVGTDLSEFAIAHVRSTLAALPGLDHVELHTGTATDLATIGDGQFDLVLLNSVVQYFPSLDYLLEVVDAATRRLAPGGVIYLGDLRHQGLLHAFHADVLLARAGDEAPIAALGAELLRRLDEEQELAIVPGALAALCQRVPGLEVSRIEVKRGLRDNELSRFRFDAMLTWQGASAEPLRPSVFDWSGALADDAALRAAVHSVDGAVRINGIPNARVARAQRAARLMTAGGEGDCASLRAALGSETDAVHPEQFWALGEQLGRPVRVLFNRDDDAAFDVVLAVPGHDDFTVENDRHPHQTPWSELASQPLRGHFMRTVVPALKNHVAANLPRYLWPDHYVLLKALPLSRNGKVDKAQLPVPERLRPQLREQAVAALTATERALAELWARLLNVEVRGAHEHFFNDLGGHSLLATQVMSRVRSQFGVELPLRCIFEGPTLAELAAAIDAAGSGGNAAGGPLLVPAPVDAIDIDALDEAELDAALARLAGEAS